MSRGELDGFLGYQLRRASTAMLADLAQSLARLNLVVTDMSVLFTIDGREARTQSDVGRILGIKRANMAPLAAGLVERGLIERVAMDGRSQALVLTPAGHDLLDRARECVGEHEERFLRNLPRHELERMTSLLEMIWRPVDRSPERL